MTLLDYVSGFGLFLIFVLDVIAIYEVLQSSRSPGGKVLWFFLIFFFPIFGCIFYYFFSSRQDHHYMQVEPV